MEWLELHIDTNHAGLEPLEIFLSANGVDGVVIDDEQDFQSFLENNHQSWDYVDEDLEASMKGKSRITFYLQADDEGFAKLGQLRTALQGFKEAHAGKYGTLLMTMENLQDADWENNWKQYYKPMEIGERLLVIPEWEQETVKGQAKYAGKIPLIDADASAKSKVFEVVSRNRRCSSFCRSFLARPTAYCSLISLASSMIS